MFTTTLSPKDAKQLNGLTLAYIGDTVYESFIRELSVLGHPNVNVYELHKISVKKVNCNAQSAILKKLIENQTLSEDDLYIVNRGKNCKSHSVPKNADRKTYMEATGFEALIGYLYMTGDEKLKVIFEEIRKEIENGQERI